MTTSLTYFDFDGSRGLECRLALTIAGVEFEDIRINREQWIKLKPNTPFGALPLLKEGERALAHSAAILSYVGRLHGFHPRDPWIAAQHEAIMQSVEDLRYKVSTESGMSDEEKKDAREAFAAGWLTQWAKTISSQIKGPFLAGESLNMADLKVYVISRAIQGGAYDHIPGSFFDAWPKVKAFIASVDAHPKVKAYFASR